MTHKAFNIDGKTVYLATGKSHNSPAVVVGLSLSEDMPDLAGITVEFPMKSHQSVEAFIAGATEETARRGLDKLVEEFGDLIEIVNRCLSRSTAQSQMIEAQRKP
ncbi:lysogeny establishment protein [Citrobacter werkmanii]|uniref:lysogeny establishment protein n=1 Tax=Citrobacter werkmanii TaxID=67827 RepID=UPI003463BC87